MGNLFIITPKPPNERDDPSSDPGSVETPRMGEQKEEEPGNDSGCEKSEESSEARDGMHTFRPGSDAKPKKKSQRSRPSPMEGLSRRKRPSRFELNSPTFIKPKTFANVSAKLKKEKEKEKDMGLKQPQSASIPQTDKRKICEEG